MNLQPIWNISFLISGGDVTQQNRRCHRHCHQLRPQSFPITSRLSQMPQNPTCAHAGFTLTASLTRRQTLLLCVLVKKGTVYDLVWYSENGIPLYDLRFLVTRTYFLLNT